MNYEQVDGWTNPETEAVARHLQADAAMLEDVHERVNSIAAGLTLEESAAEAAAIARAAVAGTWADVLAEPELRSRDRLMMYGEIGSLWCVDWDQVGSALLIDV